MSWELERFAGGKSNTFAKDRAEAKARQKWFKESKIMRRYKKELKTHDDKTPREEAISSDKARGSKRPRDAVSSEAEKVSSSQPNGGRSFPGDGSKKPKKVDPFSKEKRIAEAAKGAKQADFDRIAAAEKERAAKLKYKKKQSAQLAKRDSRGRPIVRNTLALILSKLQKEK